MFNSIKEINQWGVHFSVSITENDEVSVIRLTKSGELSHDSTRWFASIIAAARHIQNAKPTKRGAYLITLGKPGGAG